MRVAVATLWHLLFLFVTPAFAGQAVVHDPFTGKALGRAGDREVLVRLKAGADRPRLAARLGGTVRQELLTPGWVRIELPPGVTVTEALRRYKGAAEVEAVQPNYIYRPAAVQPNDTLFNAQYGPQKISASAAWELERGLTRKVTIAVLDTGIDRTHPDLDSRIDTTNWRVFCPSPFACATGTCTACSTAATCTPVISDTIGHGTAVAGVAAAETDNSEGIAGVSWGATLLPIKIFDSDGCADSVSLSDSLNYVTNLAVTQASTVGPVVVNLSVGEEPDPPTATPSCDNPPDVVTVAANNALTNNLVLVAAAGNIASPAFYQDVQCPARIPGIIAVGATDAADSIAAFSARGSALDVVAPGAAILTTEPGGTYGTLDGTSFAAPHVSGLAALIRALQPSVSQTQVSAWVLTGADSLGQPATLQGRGRVNAFRTLLLASGGSLAGFAGETKVIAFPNPFRSGQGTLAFSVPSSISGGALSVRIYTAAGDLVRTLRTPSWDGKNEAGAFVASGMYLFLVETDRGRGKGRVAVFR